MELTFEQKMYLVGIALLGVLMYNVLGIVGMRTVVGFALLMIVPFHLIFSCFKCSGLERVMFSLFAGIAIVPSIVYWLGFIIPFRLAILTTFSVFLCVGIYLVRKRKSSSQA